MAMRAIAALACAALACGQVLQVPDFFHYLDSTSTSGERKNSCDDEHGSSKQDYRSSKGESIASDSAADKPDQSCSDITTAGWPAQGEPPHFRTLNPTAMTRITLNNGHYPAKDSAYWLTTEATYVVVAGKVSMAFENGTEMELFTGDLFYSPGGVKHGPIKNELGDEAVVMALADLHPDFGEPPAIIPGAVIAEQYAFQPREYSPTGSPDLPDCLTLSVYAAPNGVPAAISANLEAGCVLPLHYHATGVLYFYTEGKTTVGGDGPKPATFSPGEARWARPGWTYGPETAGDTHTQFMVLGLPPDVTHDSPPAEFLVVQDVEPGPAQVAYLNTQFAGDAKHDELEKKRMKRVRKNLRAAAEQDDAAFLQTCRASDCAAAEEDESALLQVDLLLVDRDESSDLDEYFDKDEDGKDGFYDDDGSAD